MPQYFPLFAVIRKNFHRPPQILRFGGDGKKISRICPPQPQDQVGAPDYSYYYYYYYCI